MGNCGSTDNNDDDDVSDTESQNDQNPQSPTSNNDYNKENAFEDTARKEDDNEKKTDNKDKQEKITSNTNNNSNIETTNNHINKPDAAISNTNKPDTTISANTTKPDAVTSNTNKSDAATSNNTNKPDVATTNKPNTAISNDNNNNNDNSKLLPGDNTQQLLQSAMQPISASASASASANANTTVTATATATNNDHTVDDDDHTNAQKVNNSKNAEFPFVRNDHVVRDVYALFRVEKELGRGASCRVLRVERKEDKKRFAMKEMRKDDKWNPMLFEQEVYILSKLKGHPNILEYEDCYIDNKNFYVLTVLCTGGELFDKIKELKYFQERQGAEITRVILDAINYCHERNVVHRDLKPENIVYKDEKKEEIVLIDFGDAKEVEEHSKHDDFVGTAFYLAPEAIRAREGWELKKSDMWTIGVIAFVLVTGRPPFWGRENKEIIRKIIKGDVRFPTTVKLSEECKEFILALLQKEPEKRLSASDALKHPWITGEVASVPLTVDILKNLSTYGVSNNLKQLIVATVASNLDKKHRKEYETVFLKLDLKKDDKLDFEEIQAFLVKCGIDERLAETQAQTLVANISGQADKPISKEDWCHSNVAKLLSSDHLIERQYRKLDVDQDGFIGPEDLSKIFEAAKPDDIIKIIEEVDIDQDGYIGFQEFRHAMEFQPAYPDSD